jgi:YHS domain-containing protein
MRLINLISIGMIAAVAAMTACTGAQGVATINVDANGLAVKGYDTVAFFTNNAAVQGNPTFEYAWNGAKWVFSTAENLEKFKSDPVGYAPQFGGYCSYAVSHGYTADGDPNQWKIVDGKLYLNYNQKAKDAWEKEQEKLIKDGENNWAEFQKKKPEHKG